jgi:hypothetical protein
MEYGTTKINGYKAIWNIECSVRVSTENILSSEVLLLQYSLLSEKSDYRPISILPVPAKAFENVM